MGVERVDSDVFARPPDSQQEFGQVRADMLLQGSERPFRGRLPESHFLVVKQ